MMACKSYLIGYLHAGRQDNQMYPELQRSSIGCYKEDFDVAVRAKVVSRLFVKHLDNNPKLLENSTDWAMHETLNEAYPC